jgi:hypothetical protein
MAQAISNRVYRNSRYGEIWLYGPELDMVWKWEVSVLRCVEHGGCKGLTASPSGERHGVIIPVPVKVMEKVGTYRFVLHFYDDYGDSYKDHEPKPALEVNAKYEGYKISDVGFYYDLDRDGNYEDDEKLKWDGEDPEHPKPGEFSILRQEPPGDRLHILAHVDSPAPLPRNAKAKVRLRTSVSDTKGIKVILHYREKCPKYPNKYHFCKEILIVDPPNPSIDDKQIQIHKSPDGVAEVTTYDHISAPPPLPETGNYLDSVAIEVGLSQHQKRGRAREDKIFWGMKTPTLPTMLRFLQAAGVEKIEVFDPSNPNVGHVLPVKNQADILYYSGHGSGETGGLLSCLDKHPVLVSDINPSANWKEDLDYFIIAGCSVLKPDSTNGFAWGNATLKKGILKGLCGYYGAAPSDGSGKSVSIADEFAVFITSNQPPKITGDRVLDAWLEANRKNNSEGIAYNATHYWKVVTEPLWFDKVEGPFAWP